MYVASVKRAPDDLMGRLSAALRARHAATTRCSPACTRRRRWSPAPPSTRPRGGLERHAEHAVNLSGGLHHAMRDRASRLLRLRRPGGRDRLAAGPGRAAGGVRRRRRPPRRRRRGRLLRRPAGAHRLAARERPDALPRHRLAPTRSAPATALGTSVNVALPPGTGDAGWLRAFDAVVPPVLRAFAPQVLVTQLGCDTHAARPAGPPDDERRRAARGVRRPARARARGLRRPVGGRSAAAATSRCRWCPRAWTHLLAEVDRRRRVDGATPGDWRDEHACARSGETAPTSLTDGADPLVHAVGGRRRPGRRPGRPGRRSRPATRSSRTSGSTPMCRHGWSRRDRPAPAPASTRRIAGDVATPREENLRNIGRMAEGRRGYDFGLLPAVELDDATRSSTSWPAGAASSPTRRTTPAPTPSTPT